MRKYLARTLAAVATFAAVSLGGTAGATVLYSDGPLNGQTNAFGIGDGVAVADSFDLTAASTLTGVDFTAWSGLILSLDWSILTGDPNTENLTALYSGTTTSIAPTYLFLNQYYHPVSEETFSLPNIDLRSGTYWLELQNAVSANGNLVAWDVSGGPSSAALYTYQYFDITNCLPTNPSVNGRCSQDFDITGVTESAVPEPATFAVFGVALVAVVRRRRSTPVRKRGQPPLHGHACFKV